MNSQPKNVYDGQMSLFPGRSAGFQRFRGTRGTSGLCKMKTHEIHTEVHHESNSSLNVCPVVKDENDEEIMDDKEEQSEECRAVRVGQQKTVTPTLAEREEHERTHIPQRS